MNISRSACLSVAITSLIVSINSECMLKSPIKKLAFNHQRRTLMYTMFFVSGDLCKTLDKAPCDVSDFLNQMPNKIDFSDTKNISTAPILDTLDAENKNLLLAHVLNESPHYDDEKFDHKVHIAIAHLIKAGAHPNTLLEYRYGSPQLITDRTYA